MVAVDARLAIRRLDSELTGTTRGIISRIGSNGAWRNWTKAMTKIKENTESDHDLDKR